jgi:hypothetical protein
MLVSSEAESDDTHSYYCSLSPNTGARALCSYAWVLPLALCVRLSLVTMHSIFTALQIPTDFRLIWIEVAASQTMYDKHLAL